MKTESVSNINLENAHKIGGNRCGHVRELPRFYARPEEHKKTFDILHRASERLQEYYFDPIDNWLPCLNYARESERRQRSERREAIVAISAVMLNALDIASLGIVRLNKGNLEPLSIKQLAERAGIGERRAERAIYDLKRAKYLELDYRYETLPNGEIKPLIAIKRLSALFFYHLGITYEKLQQVQAYARKKLARFNKQARMTAEEAKHTTKQFFNKFLKRPQYKPVKTSHSNPISVEEVLRWQELMRQHPDWSPEQIKQAAKLS
jgi:hypothetical protein